MLSQCCTNAVGDAPSIFPVRAGDPHRDGEASATENQIGFSVAIRGEAVAAQTNGPPIRWPRRAVAVAAATVLLGAAIVPAGAQAMTASALAMAFAVRVVPSSGSRAMSTRGPPRPTASPM